MEKLEKYHNDVINDLDSRIHKTLYNYETSVHKFHDSIIDSYNKISDEDKRVIEEHFEDLKLAYDSFNETVEIWPELFKKEETNDTEES